MNTVHAIATPITEITTDRLDSLREESLHLITSILAKTVTDGRETISWPSNRRRLAASSTCTKVIANLCGALSLYEHRIFARPVTNIIFDNLIGNLHQIILRIVEQSQEKPSKRNEYQQCCGNMCMTYTLLHF